MPDSLPLSLLNDFLYCPRRAALKAIEGHREENEHTIRGDIAHEHADLPGYEVAKDVTLLRALPVWSERLGLSGKCDIVEVAQASSAASSPAASLGVPPDANCGKMPPSLAGRRPALRSLRPVEYKKGQRRQFDNDDAQLCAQALCLEEMTGKEVPRGAIFHHSSRRRREITFTSALRARVEEAVAAIREMLANKTLPPPVNDKRCDRCSLLESCMPSVVGEQARARRVVSGLFTVLGS